MLLLMCDREEAAGVIIWGEEVQRGAYILRIEIERPVSVAFGRYRGGQTVALPAGHLLYVGSAMGRKGSTTLARRLLRHATRSGERRPHAIRASLLRAFRRAGMGSGRLRPPPAKRLHWHVDYLLDEPGATIDAVLAIRSAQRYEALLAEALARSPHTEEIVAGLGAADDPGRTHLLRLVGGERAWRDLLSSVREELLDHQDDGDPRSQHQ